jgi:hypothetical protein
MISLNITPAMLPAAGYHVLNTCDAEVRGLSFGTDKWLMPQHSFYASSTAISFEIHSVMARIAI